MVLVEQHRQTMTPELRAMHRAASRLHNQALFRLKRLWAVEHRTVQANVLNHELAAEDYEFFRCFQAKTAQSIVTGAVTDYQNFIKALVAYKANPGLFKRRPQCPRYRVWTDMTRFSITNQQFSIIGDSIHFAPGLKLAPLLFDSERLAGCQFLSIRVIPHRSHVTFELVYDTKTQSIKQRARREKLWEAKLAKAQKANSAGKRIILDLNLSGIAVLDDTKRDCLPFYVISSGPLRARIQHANKLRAHWCSRNGKHDLRRKLDHQDKYLRWQRNELHAITNDIIGLAVAAEAKFVLVGRNKGWKQEAELGHRTNQAFCFFPFGKLITQLGYKCRRAGLLLQETEESHTSKVDHLALEEMGHHRVYLGTRITRGLFRSSTGIILHADLNGTIGIGRKTAPQGSNVARNRWLTHKVIPLLVGKGTRVVPRKRIAGAAGYSAPLSKTTRVVAEVPSLTCRVLEQLAG